MYRTLTHHICLVSAHLPANLIPVLGDRPERVHLVVSDDMRAMGERFRKLLEQQAIACEVHEGVPGTGLTELREYAEHLALTLRSAASDDRDWRERDERPDDVRAGVVGTREGDRQHPSRNEFDLLAVHANRMLVVECKTARFGLEPGNDNALLYKLDSLGRTAGGLFGKMLLISARALSSAARERARGNHIGVVEAAGLKHLRHSIRDWMGRT